MQSSIAPLYRGYSERLGVILNRAGVIYKPGMEWEFTLKALYQSADAHPALGPAVTGQLVRTMLDLLGAGLIQFLADVLNDRRVVLSRNEISLKDPECCLHGEIRAVNHSVSSLWRVAHYSLAFIIKSIPHISNPACLSPHLKMLSTALEAQISSFARQPSVLDKNVNDPEIVVLRIFVVKTPMECLGFPALQFCSRFITAKYMEKVARAVCTIWDTTYNKVDSSPLLAELALQCAGSMMFCWQALDVPNTNEQERGKGPKLEAVTDIPIERLCELTWQLPHESSASQNSRTAFGNMCATVARGIAQETDQHKQTQMMARIRDVGLYVPAVEHTKLIIATQPSPETHIDGASFHWASLLAPPGPVSFRRRLAVKMYNDGAFLLLGECVARSDLSENLVGLCCNLGRAIRDLIEYSDDNVAQVRFRRDFERMKAKGGKRNLALLIEGDTAFFLTIRHKLGPDYNIDPETAIANTSDDFKARIFGLGHFCYATGCEKRHGWDGCILKMCSRCKSAMYCSAVCQRMDWKPHKSTCVKV